MTNPPFYQPPKKERWTGRQSDFKEYWHQWVELTNLSEQSQCDFDIALLGYQCEEGVRKNQGRLGAKEGPNAIRKMLGKLPAHREDIQLSDCGDLVYSEEILLETFQLEFSKIISKLIQQKVFPIALGGGHDMSYAHFLGIHDALYHEGKSFGIINFDAHFDLRKEDQATSGTPFNQVLKEFGDHTHYAVLGIQQSSNTKALFEIAEETKSNYLFLEDCNLSNIQKSFLLIDELSNRVDYIYVTVDMDGFSSSYSPGVSAPSSFGLTPDYVLQVIRYILKTEKVVALDFAEINPTYDIDNATARLAAKLVWEVVQGVQYPLL